MMNSSDKQWCNNLQPEPDKVQPGPGNGEPEQDEVQPTKVHPEPDKIQPDNAEREPSKVQPANIEPELNKVQPGNIQLEPDKVQHPHTRVQSELENQVIAPPTPPSLISPLRPCSDSQFEELATRTAAVKPAKEFLHEKPLSTSGVIGGGLVNGDKNPFDHANEEVEEFMSLPNGDPSLMASSLEASVRSARGAVEASPQGRYLRYPEKLGSGQYKDVYRAYDTQEGIEVAWNAVNLNNLPKQERLRIMNEVRLLQNLDHMNLVQFHGSWLNREAQQVVFVTEFLVNGSLKEFIEKIHVIRWKVVKRWTRQILRGLEYLHSKDPPIIHRDLKCDNIFINGHTGDLRIGDLGLSTTSARTDKRMSVLGTPEFMAPELYDETYNEKVDIYAFGMCLVEMITKERPYAECSNAAQIYKKVVYRKMFPAALEHIQNKRARDFIKLCLDHSPDARPSATELLKHEFLIPNEVEDNEEVTLKKCTFAPLLEEETTEGSAAPLAEAPAEDTSNIDGKSQTVTDASSLRSSNKSTISLEEGGDGASGEGKGAYVSSSAHQPSNGIPEISEPLKFTELTYSNSVSPYNSSGSDAEPIGARKKKSISADLSLSGLGKSRADRSAKSEQLFKMLQDMPGNESQMRKVNLLEGRVERVSEVDEMNNESLQRRQQAAATGLEFDDQLSTTSSINDRDNSQAAQGVKKLSTIDASYAGAPQTAAVTSTQPKPSSVSSQPQIVRSVAPPPGPPKHTNVTSVPDNIYESPPSTTAPLAPTVMLERSATSDSSSSLKSASAQLLPQANSNSKPSEEQYDHDTHVKYASSQGAEADVLRLVMHAHMEGRLQEVEFDFHLEHDNDVEVAEEMIKELTLPETELDHIAKTIRSLANRSRNPSFQRVPSSGGLTASEVAHSEGVTDKEVPVRNNIQSPLSLGGTPSSLGTALVGCSHNLETAEAPRQQHQQLQGGSGGGIASGSAGGGQNIISGGGTFQQQQPSMHGVGTTTQLQQQQPQVGLGGNLPSYEDPLANNTLSMGAVLLFDGEDEDVEVDEVFEKEREKYKKKVRTAQKAYEARQHKLVIAHNDCVEENRRMQEKFKKTCEGFEQKKYLMAVEFEQRMKDFSKEWIELKQRAREDREQQSH